MTTWKKIFRFLFKPERRISTLGFLSAAANISLFFLILKLAGFRQYMSLLSGTLPSGATNLGFSLFLASCYIMLYFAFVILVPILLIASGLMYFMERNLSIN